MRQVSAWAVVHTCRTRVAYHMALHVQSKVDSLIREAAKPIVATVQKAQSQRSKDRTVGLLKMRSSLSSGLARAAVP